MSLPVRLVDLYNNVLGASWFAPIRNSFFGEGPGIYHSPVDFTATIKVDGAIHITGLSPTITNASQFRSVKTYDPSGALIGEFYPCEQTPFLWDSVNSYLRLGGVKFGNATWIDVEVHAAHRAYSSTEDAYQAYSVNPEHAWTGEIQYTAAAQGDGTTNYYWDVDTFKYWGVQIADTPGAAGDNTYTIAASWEDNGTAAAASAYTVVHQPWFGVAATTSALITANAYAGVLEVNTPLTCKFIRLQVVRANDGAATDGAWTIDARSTY
jgi:hypothetical protein